MFRQLSRWHVLILDEYDYVTLSEEQANLLFKLIDSRYRKAATIFTSNLGYDDWGTFLPRRALTKSLISRIIDNCHVVRIEGPSLRGGPRDDLTKSKLVQKEEKT